MKKWICTICKYTHAGELPPDKCPICGAPASAFMLISEDASSSAGTPSSDGLPLFIYKSRLLSALARKFHIFQFKPITVHFPNGLIPTSFLFLLLTFFFDGRCIDLASFYLLCVATTAGPFAVATGIYNWRTRYKSAITAKLMFKLYGGIVFTVLGILTIAWRLLYPGLVTSSPLFYLCLNFVLLTLVTVLGHIGGSLVFARHR